MLVVHASLSVSSLVRQSVTIDEFGHLPAGMLILETGDLSHATLNPPLMNGLAALPARWVEASGAPNPVSPGARALAATIANPFWRGGYRLMVERGADYQRLFLAARLVSVAVTLLLGVVVYRWARELAPERAALAGAVAAGLVLFSPNLLAHGGLVTTDAGAAAAMTMALYASWRFSREPGPVRAVMLGAALGLALLVKFTALVWVSVIALQVGVAWGRGSGRRRRRLAGGAFVAAACALFVLHLGYGFQHPFPRVADVSAEEPLGGALQGALSGGLRLPVPLDYLVAFSRQAQAITGGDASYLLGEAYHGGRPEYFGVLLATKVPLAILGLSVLLGAAWLRSPGRGGGELFSFLVGPCLLLFAIASLGSQKQIGLRMILPLLPLWFCLLGVLAARLPPARWRDRLVFAAVAGVCFTTVRAHPHFLSYYNLGAGGSERGHRVALDSNYDWGQDLIALREQLDELAGPEDGPVQLIYYGRVDPALYGIEYEVPKPGRLRPGLLAVSRSSEARSYFAYDHGELVRMKRLDLRVDRIGEEVGSAGHSIRLIRVKAQGRRPES